MPLGGWAPPATDDRVRCTFFPAAHHPGVERCGRARPWVRSGGRSESPDPELSRSSQLGCRDSAASIAAAVLAEHGPEARSASGKGRVLQLGGGEPGRDRASTSRRSWVGGNGAVRPWWRSGRDSNPRRGCPLTAFPVPRPRPLGDRSILQQDSKARGFVNPAPGAGGDLGSALKHPVMQDA